MLSGCCGVYDDYYKVYDHNNTVTLEAMDTAVKISEVYYEPPIDFRQPVNSRFAGIKQTKMYDSFSVVIHSDIGYDTVVFTKGQNEIRVTQCDSEKIVPFFNVARHTFNSVNISGNQQVYDRRRLVIVFN